MDLAYMFEIEIIIIFFAARFKNVAMSYDESDVGHLRHKPVRLVVNLVYDGRRDSSRKIAVNQLIQ